MFGSILAAAGCGYPCAFQKVIAGHYVRTYISVSPEISLEFIVALSFDLDRLLHRNPWDIRHHCQLPSLDVPRVQRVLRKESVMAEGRRTPNLCSALDKLSGPSTQYRPSWPVSQGRFH